MQNGVSHILVDFEFSWENSIVFKRAKYIFRWFSRLYLFLHYFLKEFHQTFTLEFAQMCGCSSGNSQRCSFSVYFLRNVSTIFCRKILHEFCLWYLKNSIWFSQGEPQWNISIDYFKKVWRVWFKNFRNYSFKKNLRNAF